MAEMFDITLTIREDMVTYPDNPETRLIAHDSISEGDDANVTELRFGSHTGTHLDAAHHFVDGGQTVDRIPLDVLIGPARVVEIPGDVKAIGAAELRDAGIEGEERVLLKTRNSELLGESSFREDFSYISGDGARHLVESGVRLVGIDYLSVEAFDADEPVTHQTLLQKEIVVVEGLDLRQVPAGRYELLCLPLKVAIDGAPVRAVLRQP